MSARRCSCRCFSNARPPTTSCLQELSACIVPSTPEERRRKRFASSRNSFWIWFIEVTVFRVLAHYGIALHGMHIPTESERSRLTASIEGQLFAAELLTRNLLPSVREFKSRSSQAATVCKVCKQSQNVR